MGKSKKLNTDEKETIRNFIRNYISLDDRFKSIEETIVELQKEKDVLLEELNDLRTNEKKFGEDLDKKYGKGKLNLKNFNYELEDNIKQT